MSSSSHYNVDAENETPAGSQPETVESPGRDSFLRAAADFAKHLSFGRAFRILLGATVGFLSAFVVTLAAVFLLIDASKGAGSTTFWAIPLFIASWVVSSVLLLRNQGGVSTTIARAFLLGAAEALLIIPVGLVATARLVPAGFERGGIEGRWVAIQATGASWIVIAGVSMFVAIFFLLGYVVTVFIRREIDQNATHELASIGHD